MEFFNIVYAISITFIFFSIYKIPMRYYLITLLHLFLIFGLNDVLFPASYLPDQFRYFNSATALRDSMDFIHFKSYARSNTVGYAGLLFSISPIPFISSIYSIAIINYLIYTFLFIFLYKKSILIGGALWFYLLFPSLALYSALSLRDTWILLFMIISVYFLYKEHILLSIVVASPLILIKPQNFFIYILSLIVYMNIKSGISLNIKNFFKLIGFLTLLGVFISLFSIEKLNFIRRAMYQEDGGNPLNYIPVTDYADFFIQGILGAFYMIVKPLPWQSSSAMQLIQSFENLFVFYLTFKIIKEQIIIKDTFITFLLIYFFIGMLIYGLVVFNFGTAARYRYTFEVVFFVFSLSILYKQKSSQENTAKVVT